MFYLLIFLASLALSALATVAVRHLAFRFRVLDWPDAAGRKIHEKPMPLLGGLAIFFSYFLLLFLFAPRFLAGNLEWRHLIAFAVGALILMIGGVLDDKKNLSPRKQIIFPLLAVVAVLAGGIEIGRISNPLGGYFDLSSWSLVGSLIVALWLLGMMYTTKLLDGVDGLVSGISAIGGLVIFLFTLTTRYYQPDIAMAAILLAGASAGFLIFNWHPAKIFLGEGGALLLGYILGVLAIISGGKIAIALLVMGIPVMDVAWTILRRLAAGKNPFRTADKKHLHHRLLDLGLSQRQTVLVFYVLALGFGLSGLFLQSRGKFLALLLLVVLMFVFVIALSVINRRRERVGRQPSLLLHVCCAPCAAYHSQAKLISAYRLGWYFDNPNLESREEYDRRLAVVKEAAEKFSIPLIIQPYEHASWRTLVSGCEGDPERGERCRRCYRDRLARTASLAREKGFDFFSTSLLVSPYKDTAAIREISWSLAVAGGPEFLDEDFQADDGYRRSQEFARSHGWYRQKYCGCEFSLGQRA